MLKICDFSFYVDIEPIYWPANMHESLLIDIYLLLFHFSPWTLIRSVSVLEVDRKLCLMRIEKQGLKDFFASIYPILVESIRHVRLFCVAVVISK